MRKPDLQDALAPSVTVGVAAGTSIPFVAGVTGAYVRAELLVIDDFALLAMDPAQAKLAFQVISERYDYRRSTVITTNRPFKSGRSSRSTESRSRTARSVTFGDTCDVEPFEPLRSARALNRRPALPHDRFY